MLVPTLPAMSRARLISTCDPFATERELHVNAYGALVSAATTVPSTRSSTEATARLSLAEALTATSFLSVAPGPGEMIAVAGDVASWFASVTVTGAPSAALPDGSIARVTSTYVPSGTRPVLHVNAYGGVASEASFAPS